MIQTTNFEEVFTNRIHREPQMYLDSFIELNKYANIKAAAAAVGSIRLLCFMF